MTNGKRTGLVILACGASLALSTALAAQGVIVCPAPSAVDWASWDGEGNSTAWVVDLDVPLSEDAWRSVPASESPAVARCDPDRRPLTVTCESIGEVRVADLAARGGRRVVGHDIGLWTKVRRTEDGQERNLVVTTLQPGSTPGVVNLRVVLEQRQSKRVHRELVLGELECPVG